MQDVKEGTILYLIGFEKDTGLSQESIIKEYGVKLVRGVTVTS
jgi:hypothetical protein